MIASCTRFETTCRLGMCLHLLMSSCYAYRALLDDSIMQQTQEIDRPQDLNSWVHAHPLQARWLNRTGNSEPQRNSGNLVAFTASNAGHKTASFLASVSLVHDSFDLLALDERSTDNTAHDLATYEVPTIHVDDFIGVTALWNLAWRYFQERQYEALFISNNDVLIPNGVIDKLKEALDAGCDLVSPLSTKRGKGHVGFRDGLEVVFGLDEQASALVNHPAYYQQVQDALDAKYAGSDMSEAIVDQEGQFNGFFFGVSSRAVKAAFSEEALFDTSLHNFHQEEDLDKRLRANGMRICLHKGAFVYHFKGATIPLGDSKTRTSWRRSKDL